MTSTPLPPSAPPGGGLPFPVVSAPRRSTPARTFHSAVHRASSFSIPGERSHLEGKLAFLTQRARTTNLAVLLLAAVTAISLIANLRFSIGHEVFPHRLPSSPSVPLSIRATLPTPHSNLKHLVMVPGHAIWEGCDASHATTDQDWLLEPFQRGRGMVKTYLKHITKGAEIAVQDPEALLIYSGGQTKPDASLTEAQSYARLAKAGNIYAQFMTDQERTKGGGTGEFDRVTTEDFAMDSMENVLFSIARFKEFTGHYPTFITAVGYGMKRRRYEDVHRLAIKWPAGAFKYIGIDNEGDVSADYEGENANGLTPFLSDLYGCKGGLVAKRRGRNPFRRFHSYFSSAPELEQLFEYCPADNKVFPGRLPWD
ncbi:hypothetical protein JCM1840_004623 [Sporobolomyces johnsonii]